MKTLLTLIAFLALAGCSSITPSTLTNAFTAHAGFPSLSVAVSECVAGNDDVRSQIADPFNRLVDKWSAADDLELNASLVQVLVGAQSQVQEAKDDWILIKSTIVDAGIDCGPAVSYQVTNVEKTFAEIESAVNSSERVVYALEWGQLLASVVLGQRGQVVRLDN